MSKNGLLIDYTLCTGCHSCEVSCKYEHKIPSGQWGIKITDDDPFQIDAKKWEFKFVPIPTQICDLCADRTAQGQDPACVHNCCARVMEYGTIEQLVARMNEIERPTVLFAR